MLILWEKLKYFFKGIFNSILSIAVLLVLAWLIFYFIYNQKYSGDPLVSFQRNGRSYTIKIREREKEYFHSFWDGIKEFFYDNANMSGSGKDKNF
jgi:hypothetical protein